jgi:DNA-binding SARP family transcriptional activator
MESTSARPERWLRVVDGDKTSSISSPKTEQLLATLLIRFDQVVTIDQIIAELWGDQIPRRALAGVYVYISQLRKFLSSNERQDNPVVTHSSGYILRLGSDEIDFKYFHDLANAGRKSFKEEDYQKAAACFDSALALWRGPIRSVFGSGPISDGFVSWVTEARLECIEMLMDCRLILNQHRELIGRLYALTAEHPLREAFYLQLMRALYQSDRQADALAVYQRARQTIQEELGLEPCRALQNQQRAILEAATDPHVRLRAC